MNQEKTAAVKVLRGGEVMKRKAVRPRLCACGHSKAVHGTVGMCYVQVTPPRYCACMVYSELRPRRAGKDQAMTEVCQKCGGEQGVDINQLGPFLNGKCAWCAPVAYRDARIAELEADCASRAAQLAVMLDAMLRFDSMMTDGRLDEWRCLSDPALSSSAGRALLDRIAALEQVAEWAAKALEGRVQFNQACELRIEGESTDDRIDRKDSIWKEVASADAALKGSLGKLRALDTHDAAREGEEGKEKA